MNSSIRNLNHALAFQLEGAYEIVKQLQDNLSSTAKIVNDQETRSVFIEYKGVLNEQRLRLKRIFSYLMTNPYKRKTPAHFITDPGDTGSKNVIPQLRDIILCNSLHAAVNHLITTYTDARYIAMRLDLDVVVNLLNEIITAEEKIEQDLKRISSEQVSQACLLVTD